MRVTDVSRSNDSTERPIRLLLVAPALRILGGQAVQANYLLDHLSHEPNFEVSFVPHNPRLPRPLRWLQSIKYVRTLVTSFVYCINLLIQVPRHDIVHTFSASYLSFLLAPAPAILIARLFNKKVVLNYRSGEAEDHLRCWPRTSVPIMRLADELVVPSQYLIDVFWKFGLRAIAVANIIDPDRFRFKERKPLLPIFLSNRNLYPLYNVACILRAFAKIQEKFPEARLIIAGDGSQRTMLEALARELKLEHVEFRGRVAPHKMHELYDEAHIFLNSSNIDNMPGSILESFATGMPVISTSAGGIRCIVAHEQTGLLVPRNDHDAMAAWAMHLLESPEIASSIARNAYEECAAYKWEAVREKWLAAYARLAGREASTAGSVVAGQMIHDDVH
ncbi:MAG TPA: glycosyltransferase family 4 protein [Pyrinomonadaceae bacterium]|jgi:glycosyltransferase involved in cell wall biosynthesis|nr:glycosyltransferase family 4 protein [Pyrinomonadaceae bacterium]